MCQTEQQTTHQAELCARIEAIVFVSEEPINEDKLAQMLACEKNEVIDAIADLHNKYQATNSGIMLQRVAGGYTLVSKPEYSEYIEILLATKNYRLSKASLETLAIIAYKQPITRVEIEEIRGVKSERVIANLLSRSLIEEVGRQDTVGRPILYGTTNEFLLHFGLNSTTELPRPDNLKL